MLMMPTYQVENWNDVKEEMSWLWPLHWQEVENFKDKTPLDMDIDKYDRINDRGMLYVITARFNGEILGYVMSLLDTHLHYKNTLCATNDAYFLHSDYRKGLNGVKMIDFADNYLFSLGAQKIFMGDKIWSDPRGRASIFEFLGYEPDQQIHVKSAGQK